MKKKLSIVLSLLFVIGAIGIAFITSTPGGSSTYSATPATVKVGEFITITNHITGPWLGYTPRQDFTIYGTGGVVKISGPKPSVVPTIDGGESIDVVWTYKAICAGSVAFGSDDMIYTNYVDILPKPTPMQQFMNILGFGKKK